MTTVISVLNLTSDNPIADVDLKAIDPAEWVLVNTEASKDDSVREAIYQMAGADPDYPATARIGYYRTASKGGVSGNINVSIKLSTFVQKVVDGVTAWTLPATFTLATSMPGNTGVPNTADFLVGVQNLVSFIAQAATAGVLDETQVDKLKFGIVNVL